MCHRNQYVCRNLHARRSSLFAFIFNRWATCYLSQRSSRQIAVDVLWHSDRHPTPMNNWTDFRIKWATILIWACYRVLKMPLQLSAATAYIWLIRRRMSIHLSVRPNELNISSPTNRFCAHFSYWMRVGLVTMLWSGLVQKLKAFCTKPIWQKMMTTTTSMLFVHSLFLDALALLVGVSASQ